VTVRGFESWLSDVFISGLSHAISKYGLRRQPPQPIKQLVAVTGESRFQHADARGRDPSSLEDNILG
jgi:hypothetical protein